MPSSFCVVVASSAQSRLSSGKQECLARLASYLLIASVRAGRRPQFLVREKWRSKIIVDGE